MMNGIVIKTECVICESVCVCVLSALGTLAWPSLDFHQRRNAHICNYSTSPYTYANILHIRDDAYADNDGIYIYVYACAQRTHAVCI